MKREQTLQKAIVDYLRYALPPEWKVASIPNGGHRASARITNHAHGHAGRDARPDDPRGLRASLVLRGEVPVGLRATPPRSPRPSGGCTLS